MNVNEFLKLGQKPYIVAEVGVHHLNNLEKAIHLIDAAHRAGADAIKFQSYKADRIVTTWAPTYWNDPHFEKQFDVFKDREWKDRSFLESLFQYGKEKSITILSTPFDEETAEILNDLGMLAFKVASADLTHKPLIKKITRFNKPILLSTGASTFKEIQRTIDELHLNPENCIILHCSLSYPTVAADANLSRIEALRCLLPGFQVGYSDHTQPSETELACPLAAGLGAVLIEKHFTLDRSLPGDDHYHSVDEAGLRTMVTQCRQAMMMTSLGVELTEAEMPARTFARRSIVASKDLAAGALLSLSDIDFKRPGTGVSPMEFEDFLGKRLKVDLRKDDLVLKEHLS